MGFPRKKGTPENMLRIFYEAKFSLPARHHHEISYDATIKQILCL